MDIPDGHLWSFPVFVLLICMDFILSAAGAALQTLSDSTIEEYDSAAAKRVSSLKDNPMPLIRACWLFHILTALPAGFLISTYSGVKSVLVAVLCGVIVYLFSKSLPRLVGKKYAVLFGLRFHTLTRALICMSMPLTSLLTLITNVLAALVRINPRQLEDEVTEDEIISMVNEGHEQGVLDEHEAEMINNIFRLDDTQAQDIMTHRKNIAALDGELPLTQAIAFMIEEANSRFPVYDGNIDNIIGVLHVKDAMSVQAKGEYASWLIKDIPDLIRKVDFIPETRSIDDLFRSMQHKKVQMVIVVDEYGETAGLVTMEDILEEIVGNILDEYDVDEHNILPDGSDAYLMAGMTTLSEAQEVLQITFDSEDYDTLNGYLVSCLDRIPDVEDHSEICKDGWRFTIREVEGRMIKWVRVSRDVPAIPDDADTKDTLSQETPNMNESKKE